MREITDLSELREIELSIMKKIHVFCEENSIRYFLAYGTLLGAVRHKGFIPWDDDIDIWMFREDYDKFRTLFPKYGEGIGLYIVGKDTKPYFPRNMYKVCDSRTELEERKYLYQDKFGVFVDIWPLDGTPNNFIARKLFYAKQSIVYRILYCGILKREYFAGGIIRNILRELCNIIGLKNVLDYSEALAKNYKIVGSKYVECCAGLPIGLLHEDFENRHLVKFEDTEFYIPNGYDRLLTLVYGNYMEPPPKEKQIPHHVQNTSWL